MKAKLKGKGHLLNRNLTSYKVGNDVCGALSKWAKQHAGMKNLKLSLQVKKVISESSKLRFNCSGSNLMAKNFLNQ